jgi:hypothetical protein
MKPETLSGARVPSLAVAMSFKDVATSQPDEAIQLGSCPVFQWIVVRTRRSVYDIIVLSGDAGEVMVRGGRFFPEFRRATVVGSTFGGSAVRVGSICAGCRMELEVAGKFFLRDSAAAIGRFPPAPAAAHRWLAPG